MILDFTNAFPEASDGSRHPLPKQQLFLDKAMSKDSPKYVRYVGGIGSGKTLILCITILILAVMYPGDYLIGRQFAPELRDTTLKTFLEVLAAVGKELLVEHRVADGVIRVRSRGGVSNVLFRGLDEPEKLKSLNLNGFGIDEANQVSEAAFTLLQGRLRGKHVRKGFLVQNSGGHDWTHRWFVKQDMLKTTEIKAEFYNIKAPSTENKHLPHGYVETILNTWSEDRIRREIYADEDAFEGQVYSDFRANVHVVQPFKIPEDWTRVIGADHGFRNPTCWLWGAVDYDNNVYIYREFYKKEWLIEEICKGKTILKTEPGVLAMMKDPVSGITEKIQGIYIDPSTRNRRGTTGKSDWDAYVENLPEGLPLLPARNDKTAGIDRVKTYLKVNPVTKKPQLFFFNTCENLIEEIAKYRYEELAMSQQGKKNEKEDPRKVDDHACLLGGFTKISTKRGLVDITKVTTSDFVLTSLGYRRVLVSGCTGTRPVFRYDFSDGSYLAATADHPILLSDGSKKSIHDLTIFDTVCKMDTCKSSSMGSFLGRLVDITELMEHTVRRVSKLCTAKYGSSITEKSPSITTSTTGTIIPITTTYQTLNAYLSQSIYQNILVAPQPFVIQKQENNTLTISEVSPKNGTEAPKGVNGIGNMLSRWLRKISNIKYLGFVKSAESLLRLTQPLRRDLNTVTRTAGPPLYVGEEKVYNLSVEGVSEFYANGILVSNCDALRYLIMSQPEPPKVEEEIWEQIKYNSIQGSLYRDLQHAKKPNTNKDPFGE